MTLDPSYNFPPPSLGSQDDTYRSPDHTSDGTAYEHSSHGNGQYVSILFLFLALTLGAFCRSLTLTFNIKLPYTVLLLLGGLGVGALHSETYLGEYLHESIEKWKLINPHLLLFSFLPGLVFESAFNLEWHLFSKCLSQALVLATLGVAFGVCFTGAFAYYVFPYDWDWNFCFMLGAVVSATDPVAVVALLRELGASKRLSTLIEGESLLNDGTAIVLFLLFFDFAKGIDKTSGEIVVFFIQVPLVGPCIGLAFALMTLWWLGKVYSDALVDISLTVVDCYLVFFISEEIAGSSGVLGVVTLGAYLSAVGKPYFQVNKEVEETLHHFWGMMTYGANTVIFILSGVIIMTLLLGEGYDHWKMSDVGWNILLYIFLNLVRGLIVLILYPILSRLGYGLDWQNAVIVVYGGLRGAVGLGLALIVHEEMHFSPHERTLFLFHVGGIVILTLCVNGSTTGYLLAWLGLMEDGINKSKVLDSARQDMSEHTMAVYLDLFCDDTLGGCDFDVVKQYVSSLQSNSEGIAKHYGESKKSVNDEVLDPEMLDMKVLQDLRKRVLNSVRGTYHELSMTGQANKLVIGFLVDSAEEALDRLGLAMSDWEVLESKFGKTGSGEIWSGLSLLPLPSPLHRLVSETAQMRQQETAVLASWIFVKAHVKAMDALKHSSSADKVGKHASKLAVQVEQESKAQVAAAREFIKEARLCFPEVVRTIKTSEMTRELLMAQINFVHYLGEGGMLDETELDVMKEETERDLKHFILSPPGSYNPNNDTILKQMPLFSVVKTEEDVELLQRTCRPIKLRVGQPLFTSGLKEDVVYLVGRGVVSVIFNPEEHHESPIESESFREVSEPEDPHDVRHSMATQLVSSVTTNAKSMATSARNAAEKHFRFSQQHLRTRIGSRSHEAGWILGLHEILSWIAGDDIPTHNYMVVAETVVLAFALDGDIVRKLVKEDKDVEQLLWKAAAGMLVTTHLMSSLDLSQGHTLQKAIKQGKVELTPLTFQVDNKLELVILLTGSVTCKEYGTIDAPALLTCSNQLVVQLEPPTPPFSIFPEEVDDFDVENEISDAFDFKGLANPLSVQIIEYDIVFPGMLLRARLLDELAPDVDVAPTNLAKMSQKLSTPPSQDVRTGSQLRKTSTMSGLAMRESLGFVEDLAGGTSDLSADLIAQINVSRAKSDYVSPFDSTVPKAAKQGKKLKPVKTASMELLPSRKRFSEAIPE